MLDDGGAVGICFSGVIDVARVGAGEVVVADFRGSWWLVGVGRSAFLGLVIEVLGCGSRNFLVVSVVLCVLSVGVMDIEV